MKTAIDWVPEILKAAMSTRDITNTAGVIRQIQDDARADLQATLSKVERGEVKFAKDCDEQLRKISELPLGKRLDESLFDAVKRVLEEHNELNP